MLLSTRIRDLLSLRLLLPCDDLSRLLFERPLRHDDDQDGTNSEASFYDYGNTTRIQRRSSDSNTRRATSNSTSSSESGSRGGSSDSDGSSEGEEDERGDGDFGGKGYRVKPGSVMIKARQEAPKFTIDGGNSTGVSGHEVCWQKNRWA